MRYGTALAAVFFALQVNPLQSAEVEAPAFGPIDPFPELPQVPAGERTAIPADHGESPAGYEAVFAADVRARMLSSSIFGQATYAIAIKETNGVYKVAFVQGHYETATVNREDGSESFYNYVVGTPVCEAAINHTRAARIVDIWTRALDQGWPEKDHVPAYDGVGYDFATFTDGGEFFGEAGNPESGSVTMTMAWIGMNLTRYCRASDWYFDGMIRYWFAGTIDRNLDALEGRLE